MAYVYYVDEFDVNIFNIIWGMNKLNIIDNHHDEGYTIDNMSIVLYEIYHTRVTEMLSVDNGNNYNDNDDEEIPDLIPPMA